MANIPARPPRIVGDWTDDQTPNDEAFYPAVAQAGNNCCRSSTVSTATNRVVRGRTNCVPITYGNRNQEAEAHLNAVLPNMANAILPFVNKPMVDVLVMIIDALHMLFVAVIPSVILANRTLGSYCSRPKDHVAKSKGNIAAQLIKIFIFSIGCQYKSLQVAITHTDSVLTASFVSAAVTFVCDRLGHAKYDVTLEFGRVMSYVWGNYTKVINRRADFGVWSVQYMQNLISRGMMTRTDANVTKGVIKIVVIYCEKTMEGFAKRLDDMPHHMLCNKYEGDVWNPLVGAKLYVDSSKHNTKDEDDSDNDDNDDNDNDSAGLEF